MTLADLVRDETNKLSAARCLLILTVAFSLVVIAADAWSPSVTVPEPAYTLLGIFATFFAVWAGGPRMMQYVGPSLGAVAQGLGMSRRSKEPNLYKDDER